MSADYGTARFKGYGHRRPPGSDSPAYVHVVEKGTGGEFSGESTMGSFDLADLTELVQIAGQAWHDQPAVEVRFVIEARLPGKPWQVMWSALADDYGTGNGVEEDLAQAAFSGFRFASGRLEWRLARRTTLTADEILQPEDPA